MIIDEMREWSEDEIFGKHMKEMRSDSMEECWDKINKIEVPSIAKMRQDLQEAGWVQKSLVEYQSPCGKLYRGPYGAWKAMKGIL